MSLITPNREVGGGTSTSPFAVTDGTPGRSGDTSDALYSFHSLSPDRGRSSSIHPLKNPSSSAGYVFEVSLYSTFIRSNGIGSASARLYVLRRFRHVES